MSGSSSTGKATALPRDKQNLQQMTETAAASPEKGGATGPVTEEGGIKVAVRIRPAKDGEVGGRQPLVRVDNEKRRICVTQADDGPPKTTETQFDAVYDENCKQEELYEELGVPLLDKLFNWYNGTLFAYGQTGSGKTHCMLGPDGAEGTDEIGMIPRIIREVFRRVMLGNELRAKESAPGQVKPKLIVKVSYVEIYQERLVDLLVKQKRDPWDMPAVMKIRYHPDFGVYAEGALEPTVNTYDELRKLMSEGDTRRHMAAHAMNDRSSRSHAVFTIKVFEVYDAGDGVEVPRKWARLNMCDLAGSERQKQTGAAGIRLAESSNINKGLLTLQRVISALAKQDRKSVV